MALPDWELWACAHHVQQQHGEAAARFVADRVAALAQAGDEAGVATWRAVADRLNRLTLGASLYVQ